MPACCKIKPMLGLGLQLLIDQDRLKVGMDLIQERQFLDTSNWWFVKGCKLKANLLGATQTLQQCSNYPITMLRRDPSIHRASQIIHEDNKNSTEKLYFQKYPIEELERLGYFETSMTTKSGSSGHRLRVKPNPVLRPFHDIVWHFNCISFHFNYISWDFTASHDMFLSSWAKRAQALH